MSEAIVFLGTPADSVPPLVALHEAGFDIRLVVTQPDARRGRGRSTSPSPVKAAALDLGLPTAHDLDGVVDSGATRGVVVAYGRIIPASLLAKVPMVNLHFSKLPRWRGAAPVERAILAGDAETAVAVMEMEPDLDTGPILAEEILPIGPTTTAATLRAQLVEVGTSLLLAVLSGDVGASPRPQEGTPVYAAKITAAELELDFDESIVMADRRIRVGRAWTTFAGERFIIWQARIAAGEPLVSAGALRNDDERVFVDCIDGVLELLTVQPAGRSRMDAQAWWRGAQPVGERLGISDG